MRCVKAVGHRGEKGGLLLGVLGSSELTVGLCELKMRVDEGRLHGDRTFEGINRSVKLGQFHVGSSQSVIGRSVCILMSEGVCVIMTGLAPVS